MLSKRMMGAVAVFVWAGSMPAKALTSTELAMVKDAAEHGGVASQVLLALSYRHGDRDGGLAPDPRQAARWFETAALKGNIYAQEMVAELYERGEGVEQNLPLAADWYEKAARRGSPQAQYHLGRLYLEGRGVEKNNRLAVHWLERAATEGSAQAQYLLGTLYHYGADVGRDPRRARTLLEKAALQGYESAIHFLQMLESIGYRIEDSLHQGSPDLHKLAADGDVEAQFQLALRYEHGADGEPKDPVEAVKWYRQAAEHGHGMAMRSLARIYGGGLQGISADAARARDWLRRAEAAH